ncbi:putative Prevent-host-death family protein [Desulfamplus magnetovallimortis]|uniref:Putative Prevent-host-death family protein n=1 Tax=Desulfamplus magnetovallimortis TaxID=1246637 RepID=A0A1W1HBJ3_9BACT|nr:hypothetical protein [Desulfamplus magnetovallimortis]SLM29871.1 putative Prevent-host-death family protein [Desulfamplus magnetovallimortis]
MLTITKEVLEQNIQKYFNHIKQTGDDVIVVDQGMPFIKISFLAPHNTVEDIFKDVRGKVKYHDDLLKPEIDEWGDI